MQHFWILRYDVYLGWYVRNGINIIHIMYVYVLESKPTNIFQSASNKYYKYIFTISSQTSNFVRNVGKKESEESNLRDISLSQRNDLGSGHLLSASTVSLDHKRRKLPKSPNLLLGGCTLVRKIYGSVTTQNDVDRDYLDIKCFITLNQ